MTTSLRSAAIPARGQDACPPNDAFGVEIPLTTAFDRPMLAALASEINRRLVEEAADNRLALLLAELEADA